MEALQSIWDLLLVNLGPVEALKVMPRIVAWSKVSSLVPISA